MRVGETRLAELRDLACGNVVNSNLGNGWFENDGDCRDVSPSGCFFFAPGTTLSGRRNGEKVGVGWMRLQTQH